MAVIPSEVENGAAGDAATWTGRPKAERAGSERIKSLDSSERARDVSTSLDMTEGLFAALSVYNDTTSRSAAMNMAIDEALLECATAPAIRFYCWRSPALSFGYFGKFSDVAIYAPERDLIRRWTGGGIVFHGNDLTYSIVIPASDSAFYESSMVLYEKIHRALCAALANRDLPLKLAPVGTLNHRRTGDRRSLDNDCFANPVRADVMLNGRKIAGAAQRRSRRGLLQQGSIQGVPTNTDLTQKFAQALSQNCSEFELNAEILQRARELAQRKYGTDSWLRMR
jgi:lipoyl(octanoyl) transferase